MNVRDVFDVAVEREMAEDRAIEDRERQIFLNECLREIDGEDAYRYLTYKASKILNCSEGEGVIAITNYYFENKKHFDCSFEEWLRADNGPLVRHGIKGLFPEFEVLTSDKWEIAKLAKKHYGVEIEFEFDGYEMYSLEFDFKAINSKRVDMEKVKEQMKLIIKEML